MMGIEIPAWIDRHLKHPAKMGEGRNNEIIQIGPSLLRLGMQPEQLRSLCHTIYPDIGDRQVHEIDSCIANCVKIIARDDAHQDRVSKGEFRQKTAQLNLLAFEERRRLLQILRQYAWPISAIRASSDVWQLPLVEQRRAFIQELFKQDDVIWIGQCWQTGAVHGVGHMRPCAEWLASRRIPGEFISHSTYKPGTIDRMNSTVYQRRYFVVESDQLALDDMGAVLRWLQLRGLQLRAIVTSGGRSVHGWFNWPGDSAIDRWGALLTGLKCDKAVTLKPSQPVRLPGVIRRDTQRPQELLLLR
jgi:hypothetical protein